MLDKYITIGTARSGKSTIGERLAGHTGGLHLDVVDYVYNFIAREGIPQTADDPNLLKVPYEDMCVDLERGRTWDVLEMASDFPDIFVPRVVGSAHENVSLIFCDCPLSVCLERNANSERRVPERIVRFQGKYGQDFYRNLATGLDIRLIEVNTNNSPDHAFAELLSKLNL